MASKKVGLDMLENELFDAMEEFGDDAMDAYNRAVRKTTVRSWADVILRTPVGSVKVAGSHPGRTRNNWFVGTSVTNRTSDKPQAKDGSYVESRVPRQVIGTRLFLYNNMPNALVLEYGGYPNPPKQGSRLKRGGYEIRSINGYSKQAPQGMMRVGLASWAQDLEKQFKLELAKI